ncbi:MAG: ATP-binding protein, partial [Bacteroidota bacterium]
DLLTLSQIETGEIKMHLSSFSLKELFEEVYDQLENKATKKSINLSRKKVHGVFVLGDYHRIYQVMLNLVSNAIKYTNKNGKVKIGYTESDAEITIYVRDNGDGIPQKDLKRIFERFYRVDKSRSKEKGGTGLGLAIVKHILEGHQSKIDVESEVGKGSEFRFTLARDNSDTNIESEDPEEE